MRFQRTIKKEISISGQGLHTGRDVVVKVKPASRNSGITFYRKDKDTFINANLKNVAETAFATTLSYDGVKIRTVEHFLSASAGLGIDNLIVEINGPEMPALDGSATGWVDMFISAGITKQAQEVSYIKVIKPLIYEDSHSRIMCLPYDGLKISFSINFNHPYIRKQERTIVINEKSYVTEIAPARTFGFLKEVEALQSRGLALGGNLNNAIVISDKGVINPSGLRFNDEFVRHKILDCIGDFSLVGCPIYGHFILERSGHSSNIRFISELLSTTQCYTYYSEQTNYNHYNETSQFASIHA